VAISKVGLFCVWLAVEKCESIKASGETIEVVCLTIIDIDRRALGV
jgi:hypothetical protein